VPDPQPENPASWPGSSAFASAFGRFRDHALTGFEMSPLLPHRLMDIFALPAASHVLRAGGRVLWVPSPQTTPSAICTELLRFVAHDWIRERLRILSASGADRGLGDLQGVVLPVRMATGSAGDPRATTAPAVGPAFPEAHRFLRDGVAGPPSLFVLSFDGLQALASVIGVAYQAALFPIILSAYVRLPRFHGLGFGRSDDPLAMAALPSAETHLRIREHCGRAIVFGVRPETQGFILDWTEDEGRYTLLPMA
jgi:hypothetical protein